MDKPVAVGIGELLWDMLPGGKKLGGAPADFAYHINTLGGCGIVVSKSTSRRAVKSNDAISWALCCSLAICRFLAMPSLRRLVPSLYLSIFGLRYLLI